MMPEKKTVTAALLATDIEGSTALARSIGEEAYSAVLDQHHLLLQAEIDRYCGSVCTDTGDGLWACFQTAESALRCGMAIQRSLDLAGWEHLPESASPPKVRVAIHAGSIERRRGRYRGLVFHDLSRILNAGHGGQVLLSEVAASLLRRDFPDEIVIKDLGLFRLRDAPAPERLFQVMPGGADDCFPPLHATRFHIANLPAAHTSFVGRKDELADLCSLALRPTTRLLSIVGAGGCGKTRLALELAWQLIGEFVGAVWFVPLADIHDPGAMMESIGASLRLTGEGKTDIGAAVVGALSAQPSLLILDNFEGLVPEGVASLNHLLTAVPGLRCLLTSRQRAGISFELEFELLPLPIPSAGETVAALMQSDSVQLFVDRAKRVRPHFVLSDSSAAAAAELCSRLDGIPLAIELAAAWAKVLTPRQMLAQLKEIMVSRDRDIPDRHRSLDAAIQASCRMMAPELQRFYFRLSVFRGGWDAEAAMAVCDEPRTLSFLSQLRDRSLIQADEVGDSMRFRMLETLRDFAAERLAMDESETAAAHSGHLAFFTGLAAEADRELQGKDQGAWLRRLDDESQNLRAALAGSDPESRLRLAAMLHRFWVVRGPLAEGRRWLEDALAGASPEIDSALRIRALTVAGVLASAAGDLDGARIHWEERLRLCKTTGDPRRLAVSQVNLAALLSQQGCFPEARLLYEEGLEVFRHLEDQRFVAITLSNLGALTNMMHESARARRLLEEALEIADIGGDVLLQANILHNLAGIEARHGDPECALRYIRACLKLRLDLNDRSGVGPLTDLLAYVMHERGRLLDAVTLWGAANVVRADAQTPRPPTDSVESDRELLTLRGLVPEAAFTKAWAVGSAMKWEEVIASLVNLTEDK